MTGLTRDPIVSASWWEVNLYIMTSGDNGPLFYRMGIDKSDKTDLADYEINPACAVNGTIYYNGTQENHYLYALIPLRTASPLYGTAICGTLLHRVTISTIWMWKIITDSAATLCPGMRWKS